MNAMIKTQNYLIPQTMEEGIKFAEYISSSGMVPNAYKGKPKDILCAIGYGMELGLKPFQALQSIAVINGRPSIWGDALTALAVGHPECEDFKEYIVGDGDQAIAYCEIQRKGRVSKTIKSFSVGDAKKANLWCKAGPWTSYPTVMLQRRATTFAIRSAFPDALMGFTSTEELKDIPAQEEVEVTAQDPKELDIKEPVTPEVASDFIDSVQAYINPEQREEFKEVYGQSGLSIDQAKAIFADLGIEDSHHIPVDKYIDLLEAIYEMANGREAGIHEK